MTARYVWSRRYIDAPVLRDRDAGAGGDLDDEGDDTLYYTASSGDVIPNSTAGRE